MNSSLVPALIQKSVQAVPAGRTLLQRACDCGQHSLGGECEQCKKKSGRVQRRESSRREENRGAGENVPPIVHEVLRSQVQALDEETRDFMGQRFGHDFSRVRVHTDGRAAESARAVGALAYTVGQEIVFGSGRYAPRTVQGRRLLAHELSHVTQQAGFAVYSKDLALGRPDDPYECQAERAAQKVAGSDRGMALEKPLAPGRPALQRFSTDEHNEIGRRAFEQAPPQSVSGEGGKSPGPIDPDLLPRLKEYLSGSPEIDTSTPAQSYGRLIAAADDYASLRLMQDRIHHRSEVRIPVLSRIWDFLSDTSHYVDLAAKNRQHFHPHNFIAWQSWHCTAVGKMKQAHARFAQADQLDAEIKVLFKSFDAAASRGREALKKLDTGKQEGQGEATERLEKEVDLATAEMQRTLAQIQEKGRQVQELRSLSSSLALEGVAINGFGDHFLSDAFAAGHIVTPRTELLDEFSTRLLGIVKVGGVLHCANIPSLAWHDLDNRFGVQVENMAGDRWRTYGDDFANEDKLPLGRSRSNTLKFAVAATAASIRQLWQAAAGRDVTDFSPVLNLIPRPKIGPGEYPLWPDPPQAWQRQLRFAAGENVGADYSGVMGSQTREEKREPEEVPNPKGHQIGQSILSARATCVNLLDVFSYDRFVVPMIERIRSDYNRRFYTGGPGQTAQTCSAPIAQESVTGNAVIGSLLGGLGGAAVGFLAGGILGAVIGGIVGLFLGGLIGGLIGKKREERPAI